MIAALSMVPMSLNAERSMLKLWEKLLLSGGSRNSMNAPQMESLC